jgi:DNA-binding transcriptional LysR family regulator
MAVAFQRLHPAIQVRIRAAGTNDEVDGGVADRTFDLGIHSNGSPWPGIQKLPFLEDALVGIAPVGHRLAGLRKLVSPLDLSREQFIHFGVNDAAAPRQAPIQLLIHDWFAAAGVEPPSRLNVGSLEGIKRAVRDGGGVAIVSRYSLHPDDSHLAVFPLASPPRRSFYIVTRDSGWESNVVRAFREFVVSLHWSEGDGREFEQTKSAREKTR